MPMLAAALLFPVSIALTLAAAALFADRLDHVGPRLGLPESFTGLLTAFAADGPEISSALIALAHGEKAVSLGIVLGSNAFNLAAMIGVSAILAGSVRLDRRPLLIEATFGIAATLLATTAILGLLTATLAMVLLAVLLVPYLRLISRGAHLPPRPVIPTAPPVGQPSLWVPLALAMLAGALIVLGSAGMVASALSVAHRLDVPASIVGVCVLATVTSLPNALTAIRLGLDRRGAALVSETLNSNTINLGFGVMLPGALVGLSSASRLVGFDLGWLLLMTALTVALLARPRGATRAGGVAIVGLYLVFLVVHLARP